MIPKQILELVAEIQEYRYLKNRVKRYIAYGLEALVSHTLSEAYVRDTLKCVDVGRVATISFDCDLHEDIRSYDNLLDILHKHNIKASFAVIGKFIELYPDEHKMLLESGHEIVNHTYSHPHSIFNERRITELNYEELEKEVKIFDEICMKVLNYKPHGFRAPHFINLPYIYSILKKFGYVYSSSTVATKTKSLGRPQPIDGIIEIPLTPCLKNPFRTIATWGLYRAPKKLYKNEEEFLAIFKKIVEIGGQLNAYLNFYFDPVDVVNMTVFEDILKVLGKRYKVVPYLEVCKLLGD